MQKCCFCPTTTPAYLYQHLSTTFQLPFQLQYASTIVEMAQPTRFTAISRALPTRSAKPELKWFMESPSNQGLSTYGLFLCRIVTTCLSVLRRCLTFSRPISPLLVMILLRKLLHSHPFSLKKAQAQIHIKLRRRKKKGKSRQCRRAGVSVPPCPHLIAERNCKNEGEDGIICIPFHRSCRYYADTFRFPLSAIGLARCQTGSGQAVLSLPSISAEE